MKTFRRNIERFFSVFVPIVFMLLFWRIVCRSCDVFGSSWQLASFTPIKSLNICDEDSAQTVKCWPTKWHLCFFRFGAKFHFIISARVESSVVNIVAHSLFVAPLMNSSQSVNILTPWPVWSICSRFATADKRALESLIFPEHYADWKSICEIYESHLALKSNIILLG
jgi:hypothetical protein